MMKDQYGLVLCRFKPNEAVGDMTQIKGLARGYGESMTDEPEYGFYLYIWNTNSSTWELLASHFSESSQTVSGSKTSNLSNYVDGSGFIYFLVSSAACCDDGELNVDYAACEITYLEDKYGAELYIRNFNSSQWELLDSHENSSDTTIYGTKTSNISNYLDGSNYIYLLAYQKYATPAGKTGHTYTDYAECEITYTSAIQNTYTYDVDLRRIKKDVDGTVTKFVYDGSNSVAEYNAENSLQASYITPGLDQNLAIKRSGSTYYYHQDGLGSIRNITDSSEVAQNTYYYYAFGSVLGTPTENVTNDYRFTGRRWDSESSLYYYRARMYAPTYGRFTARDPILEGNLYLYVLSNPVNYLDPAGLVKIESIRGLRRTGEARLIFETQKKICKYTVKVDGNVIAQRSFKTARGGVFSAVFDQDILNFAAHSGTITVETDLDGKHRVYYGIMRNMRSNLQKRFFLLALNFIHSQTVGHSYVVHYWGVQQSGRTNALAHLGISAHATIPRRLRIVPGSYTFDNTTLMLPPNTAPPGFGWTYHRVIYHFYPGPYYWYAPGAVFRYRLGLRGIWGLSTFREFTLTLP